MNLSALLLAAVLTTGQIECSHSHSCSCYAWRPTGDPMVQLLYRNGCVYGAWYERSNSFRYYRPALGGWTPSRLPPWGAIPLPNPTTAAQSPTPCLTPAPPSLLIGFSTATADDAETCDAALKPGDVFIPKDCRPRNRNGNCVWGASETVFWGGAGLKSFQGAKERAANTGWNGSSMSAVLAMARQAGITCVSTTNRDYKVLQDAVKNGTGFYFEIRLGREGHALAGVGIDDSTVRIIDNNGPPIVQEWSRKKFDSLWNGCACYPTVIRRDVTLCPTCRPGGPRPLPINPNHPSIEPPPDTRPINPQPQPLTPPKPDPALAKLDEILKRIEMIEKRPVIPGPQGEPGKQGPVGPPGQPGEPGAEGQPGKDVDPKTLAAINAAVETLRRDADAARAELVNLKGQRWTAILYDGANNVIQTVQFGADMPLKLRLVEQPH